MERRRKIIFSLLLALVLAGATGIGILLVSELMKDKPEEVLAEYMSHIEKQEYDAMYELVCQDEEVSVDRQMFLERNSKIYEGIEAHDIVIKNVTVHEKKNKVVPVTPAERGTITDRNGQMLAGKGTASSVGVVPGKFGASVKRRKKLARLLDMDAEFIEENLEALGFGEPVPFEIAMTKSQYSNSDTIETEVQLADSGYGQGQILMNPLHLAALYTAFSNQGDVLTPYLRYEEGKEPEKWIPGAFSSEITEQVMEGLVGVVNHPEGTGYGARREDMTLAGKTGTAEIKATTQDTSGTEIGWFCSFTTDPNTEKPLLLVSMVENVNEMGGSGYVVEKDGAVLDRYFME